MATPELDLNKIVEEYYGGVLAHVRRQTPADDAEDVTQDIFLHLTRSIGSFGGKSKFGTWFGALGRNRIADYHRKKFRERGNQAKHESQAEPTTEALGTQEISAREILALIKSDKNREVIRLRVLEGMTLSEIAENLGITYESARSSYRRGILQARKILEKD